MRLVIVFDNYALLPCAQAGWGYACYFPEKKFLFDTGSETATLRHNFSCLRLDIHQIQTVMLSHAHWDHAGGLLGLFENHAPYEVVLHRGFSPRFAGEITRLGGHVLWADVPTEILPGFYTTGPLNGPVLEAGLVVETKEGLALLTGCAHPGVVLMTRFVQETFQKTPSLVMGGFHLGGYSLKALRETACTLKKMGVKKIAPSHCTGEKALSLFAEIFGKGFIRAGVGLTLDL